MSLSQEELDAAWRKGRRRRIAEDAVSFVALLVWMGAMWAWLSQ